jgi:myo-inositol-1(or 4)-monophosphatase
VTAGGSGRELADIALALAVDAGRLIADGRASGLREVSTKSTLTDMVTEYDAASEHLIVDGLRRARPDDAIVGEEGTDSPGTSGIRWYIDPIDGTTNYMYGLPGYAVSIGARDHAGGLVGVVHLPATDETFVGVRGAGATCNGRAIRCSATDRLDQALVATGFSYVAERRSAQAARVAGLIGRVRDIRRLGAAAADLCYVAAGRLDVYYEEYLNPWDLAAGEVIAIEAGCRIGDFAGGPVRADQVLVANPALFDAARTLIDETGVDAGS